eukprot:g6698.t1
MDIVHCLRTLSGCEEDALRRGEAFVNATLVQDLEGISWSRFKPSSLKTLGKLLKTRMYLVPRTGRRVLIVNAPPAFVRVWSTIKNLVVHPSTAQLIEIVGKARTLEVLRKYLDDDVIPAYLGGTRTIDGDPECRTLLAPGGTPPQDAPLLLNKQQEIRSLRQEVAQLKKALETAPSTRQNPLRRNPVGTAAPGLKGSRSSEPAAEGRALCCRTQVLIAIADASAVPLLFVPIWQDVSSEDLLRWKPLPGRPAPKVSATLFHFDFEKPEWTGSTGEQAGNRSLLGVLLMHQTSAFEERRWSASFFFGGGRRLAKG